MDDSADATDPPGSRQVGPRPLTVVKPARRPRRHCCWPGPDSSANNAITTPVVITRNATTSANWKPSATPSPLPRPPEPPPKSTPDQRRPVTPRARIRRQVTIIFGLGLDDPAVSRPDLHCNFEDQSIGCVDAGGQLNTHRSRCP